MQGAREVDLRALGNFASRFEAPCCYADQFGGASAERRPTQVVEAQFAQSFLVATALVRRKVGIAEVDGLGDASVLALSDRIAGLARDGRPKGSVSITVRRTDRR